ncbi:expressed unknown protein [Ectocarpus siliculosus]|uniref:Uncharacterized protein n=1 Tax=Ectocarpus siliculosus TaxID=2880 RepID=D8LLY1_ECTSI|nr:expressed unknown protein [Ectocarpus siliculosus]|eukprot:CBN77195.1 expressed unknown protein [Ectocarpus siliculosus]
MCAGRLSLQVVADFLEHWELHQTLSVLKLETDMATEDLLSTEELGSIVANGAVVGKGEMKTPEGKTSPVMLQLLAACRAAPRDKENEFPLGAAATATATAGDRSERLIGEHKGWEGEEGRQEAEEEEGEDGGRRSTTWRGVGVEGDGVPPRVTLRKRRGDHGGTNGTSVCGMGNGSGGEDANEPASSVSSEPISSATAGVREGDRQSRERESDGDAEESRFGGLLLRKQPTAADDKDGGEDNGGGQGRWEHHFDGRMDEDSYDFSENVESVRGGGEDPIVAAAASGVDGDGGDGESISAAVAAAGGGVTTENTAIVEQAGVYDRSYEGEEDDGHRREEGDRFSRHAGANDSPYGGGGGGDGALRNGNGDSLAGFGGSSDNGVGVEKEPRSSVDGGVASGVDEWNEDYYEDDDFDGDDEEDSDNDDGDAGSAGGNSAADVAAKVAANAGDGEVEEEALLTGGDGTHQDGLFDPEGSRGRVSAEQEERIADLEWEARVGLSADSSVSASPMEEDGMDGPAYEIVDAQSI